MRDGPTQTQRFATATSGSSVVLVRGTKSAIPMRGGMRAAQRDVEKEGPDAFVSWLFPAAPERSIRSGWPSEQSLPTLWWITFQCR